MSVSIVESFRELEAVTGIAARFFGRITNLDVAMERSEAMQVLGPIHRNLLEKEGLCGLSLSTAEQIHGNKVAVVEQSTPKPIPGADGLITTTRGITLGIYVADCAPVWIVAKKGTAGALLHSGRKGTELGIVPIGIHALCSIGNLIPSDLIVVIGPCIRPPCYEVDFASEIRRQADEAGVMDVHDARICTSCHPDQYYSYRRERGLTGRMLATLSLLPR